VVTVDKVVLPQPPVINVVSRTHQPGEDRFQAILPEQIEWRPFSTFPAGELLAVLVGDPNKPGPCLTRVKAPSGAKLMPHKHPEDRIYTVISGTFYIGFGEAFDGNAVTAYPPASVLVLPGGTWHFHWAKSGESVSQITAIGLLGLEYAHLDDDPRHAPSPHGESM
jgi:quercetin dioxygenase-like cupin family protein